MNAALREALWLVHNGIPFDVAFDLDSSTREAFSIVFSEFQGNEFDLDAFAFKKKGD